MSKTKIITSKERHTLCSLVLSKFHKTHKEESSTTLNAYLPNYDSLKKHIQDQDPLCATSISSGRLRKLFYQPQQPSELTFGIDFIDCLYNYSTGLSRTHYIEKTHAHAKKLKPSYISYILWTSGLLITFLIIFKTWCQTSNKGFPPILQEEFEDNTYTSLKNRGWHIKDGDQTWLEKQDSMGSFTLYTLPGGYWVKPDEEIKITNTLIHPLHPNHHRLKLTCYQFLPTQRWQGVCLILYDTTLDERDCLTYCFSFHPDGGSLISGYHLKSGVPYGSIVTYHPDSSSFHGDRLHLAMEWNDTSIVLNAGINDLWGPLGIIGEIPLIFKPAYVGISATQGYSDDSGHSLHADTMAIYVDRIEIE